MNLPNKLSLVRIFITPLIIIIELFPYHTFDISFPLFTFYNVTISLKNLIIFVIFAVGCITDFFDGFIARKNKIETSFGKFIDPVTDKAMINTMLIILAYNRVIPVLPVVIMILRDIVVDGCRMVASDKGIVVAANIYGKIKTVTQMFAIMFAILNNFPFEIWDLQITTVLIWFTTFVSVFSGVHYFNQVKDVIFETK